MPSVDDWANGYLEQARADFTSAKKLATAGPNVSVLAMLYQMVCEKVAKAVILRTNPKRIDDIRKTHLMASEMMLVLAQRPDLSEIHGVSRDMIRDLIPLIDALEEAHPESAGRGRPQLEYPWEGPNNMICWPERHLALAHQVFVPTSNSLAQLTKFLDLLIWHFDRIFVQQPS